jgi:hypothetical protein
VSAQAERLRCGGRAGDSFVERVGAIGSRSRRQRRAPVTAGTAPPAPALLWGSVFMVAEDQLRRAVGWAAGYPFARARVEA